MKIVYKDIPGYEGVYKISNMGVVRSNNMRLHTRKTNRILKQGTIEGYKTVKLWTPDSKYRTLCVHKLVAQLFVPNDEPWYKKNVRHIDGDRNNNRADNLEWFRFTRKEYSAEERARSAENMRNLAQPKSMELIRKPIRVFDYKTGELLGEFRSRIDAVRAFNLQNHTREVTGVLNGKYKQTKGYRLEYIETYSKNYNYELDD